MRRCRYVFIAAVQVFLLPCFLSEAAPKWRLCGISIGSTVSEMTSNVTTEYSVNITGEYTKEQFATRPTRVLINGYPGSANTYPEDLFISVANAYKRLYPDCFNLIFVWWTIDADSGYHTRVFAKDYVAPMITDLLDDKLRDNQEAWKNLKIIGYDIGAHIAGFVGKNVRRGTVGTIIGLDPQGYDYEVQPEKYRLAKNDATYTECIITDKKCYGLKRGTCQVNFYPNSGNEQPGCDNYECDHHRAYRLYANSLNRNKFEARMCTGPLSRSCLGDIAYMGGEPGNHNLHIRKGTYYLKTNGFWPYEGAGSIQNNSETCTFLKQYP